MLSFSGLEGKQDQITGSLPGGWKQRVAFGAAIMHEPSVLFLDEPTSGVDPLARRAFWTMINRLADAGTAILVTTHYLEEAEQCNRLGLMVAGEFVAEGSPSGIKNRQPGHLLEFLVDQPQRAADLLKVEGERWRVSLFGDRLHVITDDDAQKASASTTEHSSKRMAFACSMRRGPLHARRRLHQRGGKGAAARQVCEPRTEGAEVMRRIFAQARKELTQIVRDRRTLALALLLPLFLLMLLGSAISLTVNDLPIVVQDLDHSAGLGRLHRCLPRIGHASRRGVAGGRKAGRCAHVQYRRAAF